MGVFYYLCSIKDEKNMRRKTILLMIGMLLCQLSATAQMKWNQAYQDYIDQYKDIAIREMLSYHIPASITLAQGLLESGAGRSELARKGNNHFGIKCHGWTGRKTYHDDDESGECFRAYTHVLESYEDHSKFLKEGKRYQHLFNLGQTDYKGWAYGLKRAGYATSPTYAQKLIGIIELYRLYEFDYATSYNKFITQHSDPKKPRKATTTKTNEGLLHPIHINNKNYYLVARQGDSFRSIGKEVGISWRKLARYNERDKHDVLSEGDIIYLKKKRKKADKMYKRRPHTVQPGESMYSIAQKYGMRVKYLYKKNDLMPDYQIKVGDQLRVY